ncbi:MULTISPECIES: 5'-methylthioadenosine/S-adenosylhomocysteine nucleosidase [Paracoccus]|jgi:adenosylhomocysteine nucleosidase|uniref:5'-methylthioadenosine/S-adenosylhomocysteine nucleosidase n=2 Tax=Paracoccus TaxID=265 RepID=A0A5C4R4A9_9RHOB|nr:MULTISPECIES: 5'-methylthioadenosine/S-adenosylhomocysteine nucleosidase [Paracoccus]AZY92300.1 5'-methylthioadenosine/S-adenosylhomocysteine nucleosidase [Paracoccus sp. Arc7-R13]KJZ30584.1 5'-methylthioadenosine nucleosidase [Paracoccus sp. S4493]MBF5079790.1 5'-methylthioadenosine/S-adenosylhomocysteine nucleosidase [Paracoccus sp. NBH48]TNC03693.1 5'-methylthioadenosine/S-adenosylhomocysteine nucleosidase [Paracoccus marcusii]TNH38770.1 5'-methylthioadenosine/S-adenosylhomocysteine nucl
MTDLPILFVMAAQPEYGPALRARIQPLMTGIGPIEAAVQLTAALARMDRLPRLIVSLGSAGSARLAQTEVYQVGAVAWRDMDASALGFARGCTPLLDLPRVIDLPHRIPGLPVASLSTGADIVSGPAYAAIEEDMVDMETFAHLRAAQNFGVPLIGLRGISDGAADLGGMDDWTRYLQVIDGKLAAAVDLLHKALAQGRLVL